MALLDLFRAEAVTFGRLVEVMGWFSEPLSPSLESLASLSSFGAGGLTLAVARDAAMDLVVRRAIRGACTAVAVAAPILLPVFVVFSSGAEDPLVVRFTGVRFMDVDSSRLGRLHGTCSTGTVSLRSSRDLYSQVSEK